MAFRNGTRNWELLSTRSTKRKSRPNAAPVSGTALMNRTPAVGIAVVAITVSGEEQAIAAPNASTDSGIMRRMNDSKGDDAPQRARSWTGNSKCAAGRVVDHGRYVL